MEVTELEGSRFDLALERFARGHSFSWKDATFRRLDARNVSVSVASLWRPENLSEERALERLTGALECFTVLSQVSPAFRQLVSDAVVTVELVDDYGMGTLLLASLRDGEFRWGETFPDKPSP